MDNTKINPFLKTFQTPARADPIPSSSPAFATPVHPIRISKPSETSKPSILPVQIPPATLRPQAYRTFTQKHNLNLTTSALQALAAFIGKYCGSGWRQDGLAEKVLDETAKAWKKNGGGGIVSGDSSELSNILSSLEAVMVGGRVVSHSNLSRQPSFQLQHDRQTDSRVDLSTVNFQTDSHNQESGGLSDQDAGKVDTKGRDARHWFKVVDAFGQPRLLYNPKSKHFEAVKEKATLLGNALRKTQLFRNRYNLVHQRLLRDERFQVSAVSAMRSAAPKRSSSSFAKTQDSYRLTPIANLLGRSGSEHLLLGLLTLSPTGNLTIGDLTGSIPLDVQHASLDPPDSAWFTPGMIVVVNGMYEEDESMSGESLGSAGGVGGSIGGKFIAFSLGGPPCEPREVTLGLSRHSSRESHSSSAGFGWTDFLGLGSERAVGPPMSRLEEQVFQHNANAEDDEPRSKFVIVGEVHLDSAKTLQALRKLLGSYVARPINALPLVFVVIGNFVQSAAMAGGASGGSIEYKEYFDSLASTLSEYPTVLQNATFVFVPGDNDPWASSFSAGAATPVPRNGVPGLFTSRIKRAFATANAEISRSSTKSSPGTAIWTSNPSRLTLFGPAHEVVVLRDDMAGRLRRNAVHLRSDHDSRDPTESEPAAESIDGIEQSAHIVNADDLVNEAVQNKDKVKSLTSEDHRARKLVKTILDQGYLSPFPLSIRPVVWDHASALQLYPLPTALVMMDPEAPTYTVTYQGCHVMNPGSLVSTTKKNTAQWIEYDAKTRRGQKKELYL